MKYLSYTSQGIPLAVFSVKPNASNYIVINDNVDTNNLHLYIVDIENKKLVKNKDLNFISNNFNSDLKEIEVRQLRNSLLKESDWTQLEDVPEEIKIKYKEYRKLLREIPLQEGFPNEVIWPVIHN